MAGMRAPLLDVQSSDGHGNGNVFHSGLSNGHHLHHAHSNGHGSSSNGYDHKSLNGHSYSQVIASSASGSSNDEQRLVLSSLDDSTPASTGEEGVLYGAELTDDLLWGPPLEKGVPHGTTNSQAGFSVISCMIGSGILALPHAMALLGWSSIIMMAIVCYVCLITGKLLIECQYAIAGQRMVSYRSI